MTFEIQNVSEIWRLKLKNVLKMWYSKHDVQNMTFFRCLNVLNVTFLIQFVFKHLKNVMFCTSRFWNISCFEYHIFRTFLNFERQISKTIHVWTSWFWNISCFKTSHFWNISCLNIMILKHYISREICVWTWYQKHFMFCTSRF